MLASGGAPEAEAHANARASSKSVFTADAHCLPAPAAVLPSRPHPNGGTLITQNREVTDLAPRITIAAEDSCHHRTVVLGVTRKCAGGNLLILPIPHSTNGVDPFSIVRL